jgi:hypothetical protein
MLTDLTNRITRAENQIFTIKNKQIRRDLAKMLATIDAAYTEADKELVVCRRIQRTTIRFTELHKRIADLLDNLEQHITLALLLG